MEMLKAQAVEIARLKMILGECEEIMDVVLCEGYVGDHCLENGRLDKMADAMIKAREAVK